MNNTSVLHFFASTFLTTEISATQGQVSSNLNDEMVILHVKTGSYYGLNDVGTRVWNLVQETTTAAAVRDVILSEYDVAQSKLEHDLQALLSDLYRKGLIEVRHASAE